MTTLLKPVEAAPAAEAEKSLRELVREAKESKGLSLGAIAKAVGYSTATISRWLEGSYGADSAEVDKAVRQWLDREIAAVGRALSVRTIKWVETPTGKNIIGNLMLAHTHQTLLIVFGGAGMGKTITCHQYRSTYRQCWIATMSTSATGIVGALGRIAAAVNVEPGSMTSWQLEDALVERLRETEGLLIIDEAHVLTFRALEAIRAIYDRAKIGMALFGNHVIYSRIGGAKTPEFAQWRSRIDVRMELDRPHRGDVAAVARELGVTGQTEVDFLYVLSRRPGAMREVAATIILANEIAAGQGKQRTTLPLLRAADVMRGWRKPDDEEVEETE